MTVTHSITSSRPTSCRIFAIPGPVKLLNRSLLREASGDDPRGRRVGMVRRRLWVKKRYSGRGTKRQIFTTRGRSGLSRAEILGAIRDGYGVAMSSNTAMVTLNRMQRAGVIRLDGRKSWSLSG